MPKLYALLPFLFLVQLLIAQDQDSVLVRIEGNITDSGNNPVSYAHILIPGRDVGCVGDYYGHFSIGAYSGDTLLISAVSYHKKRFVIPDTLSHSGITFHFTLEEDTVQLPETVIYPWPETYAEFKKEFIATETEDPLENLDLHLPSAKELKALAAATGGFSVSGPIGLLYDRFSKEAKNKRELQKITHSGEVTARYNPTVVSIVTGLKDEEKIKELIEYCSLSDEFILDSNDYELYTAILTCYNEYTEQGE